MIYKKNITNIYKSRSLIIINILKNLTFLNNKNKL